MFTHPKTFLTVLLAFGVLLGCEAQTGDETGATADETVAEASAPDVASVRSAIEAGNEAWIAAATAGDAAALTTLYTDDAYVLIPDQDLVHGSEEIQAAFAGWFEQVNLEDVTIDIEHLDVAGSGDVAYAVGTFTDRGTLADGTTIEEAGKFTAVYENVDGEWRMVADAWNANAAPESTQ